MVTVQSHSDKYQLKADGESEELWAAQSLHETEGRIRWLQEMRWQWDRHGKGNVNSECSDSNWLG